MMKIFRIQIILLLLLILTMSVYGFQKSGRRTGYIPHSQRIIDLTNQLEIARGSDREDLLLSLAQMHYEQAELYGLIARSAAAIGNLYFSIMEENEIDAGVASDLYRGIGLFELGKFPEAEKALDRFIRQDAGKNEDLKTAGQAWMGAVRYAVGDREGALEQWEAIPDPARRNCSVMAFVHGRVGYNVDDLKNRCSLPENLEDEHLIPFIQSMISTGRFDSLPALLRMKSFAAAHIEHEGSERELRFFNPSEIVTLSHAHYALAMHYADKSAQQTAQRFYTGVFYFKTGSYLRVIDTLTGTNDLHSAVFLAGAYYKSGQRDIANEIFDYIERSENETVLNDLYSMYAVLGVENKKERAVHYLQQHIDNRQLRSRRDVPQEIFMRLGMVYYYGGDYETAHELLGTAFRSERPTDLRANDPAFLILYGSSIVMSRNFISLSEAIEMFSTVMQSYQPAIALVEMTSLIDVATNIGREGRIIYRR